MRLSALFNIGIEPNEENSKNSKLVGDFLWTTKPRCFFIMILLSILMRGAQTTTSNRVSVRAKKEVPECISTHLIELNRVITGPLSSRSGTARNMACKGRPSTSSNMCWTCRRRQSRISMCTFPFHSKSYTAKMGVSSRFHSAVHVCHVAYLHEYTSLVNAVFFGAYYCI